MNNNQTDRMQGQSNAGYDEVAKEEEFKTKVKALIVSRDQLKKQNDELKARVSELESRLHQASQASALQQSAPPRPEIAQPGFTPPPAPVQEPKYYAPAPQPEIQPLHTYAQQSAPVLAYAPAPLDAPATLPDYSNPYSRIQQLELQNQQMLMLLNKAMAKTTQLKSMYDTMQIEELLHKPGANAYNQDDLLLEQLLLERIQKTKTKPQGGYAEQSQKRFNDDMQREIESIRMYFESL